MITEVDYSTRRVCSILDAKGVLAKGRRKNNFRFLLGGDCVVPAGKQFVFCNLKFCHLLRRDSCSGLILSPHQIRSYSQTRIVVVVRMNLRMVSQLRSGSPAQFLLISLNKR